MGREKTMVQAVVADTEPEKYSVVSYNKYSHHVIFVRDGHYMQITKPDYDGSGFVEYDADC